MSMTQLHLEWNKPKDRTQALRQVFHYLLPVAVCLTFVSSLAYFLQPQEYTVIIAQCAFQMGVWCGFHMFSTYIIATYLATCRMKKMNVSLQSNNQLWFFYSGILAFYIIVDIVAMCLAIEFDNSWYRIFEQFAVIGVYLPLAMIGLFVCRHRLITQTRRVGSSGNALLKGYNRQVCAICVGTVLCWAAATIALVENLDGKPFYSVEQSRVVDTLVETFIWIIFIYVAWERACGCGKETTRTQSKKESKNSQIFTFDQKKMECKAKSQIQSPGAGGMSVASTPIRMSKLELELHSRDEGHESRLSADNPSSESQASNTAQSQTNMLQLRMMTEGDDPEPGQDVPKVVTDKA